jgi:sec-independent protein translocase protein TatB
MFDLFSWNHILILLIVALVVVGPKDLPRLMHMMGRWAGKARGMANEFKRSFDDMARQSELEELRKEVEALKSQNPLSDIQQKLEEPLNYEIDEPRAGEFQVTDTSVPDAPAEATPAGTAAPEPAPASERAAS